MKPKKYTLNFINLGKDNKVYLRYFVTYEGKGYTKNIPCNVVLTKNQLELLKSGELGGIVQKELLKQKQQQIQVIETLNAVNNGYCRSNK